MKFSHAVSCGLALSLCAGAVLAQPKPRAGLGLSTPRPSASAPAPAAADNDAKAEKARAGALAAAGWLVLLDRGDWGTAWETSSSVFRGAVPLAAWMEGIPKVRQPLGNLVERAQVEAVYKTTLQGRPDGDYVTVIFKSKFANKQVQEAVTTVLDTDGHWRVTGYSAQ